MTGRRGGPHRIEVSATQLVAGSAAAACGAWLASKIGLAGTVIGAAVVSALVTVLSAVYAQGVRRAREELKVRRELLKARPKLPASYAEEEPEPASEPAAVVAAAGAIVPEPAAHELEQDELETTTTMVLPAFELEDAGGYRWGRITLAALAVFVVAMLVVTVVELIDGHSLTCTTSGKGCDEGTTLLPIKHPKPSPGKSSTRPTPSSTPSPTPSPSVTLSTAPSDTASASPSGTGSATATPSDTSSPGTSSSPPTG